MYFKVLIRKSTNNISILKKISNAKNHNQVLISDKK